MAQWFGNSFFCHRTGLTLRGLTREFADALALVPCPSTSIVVPPPHELSWSRRFSFGIAVVDATPDTAATAAADSDTTARRTYSSSKILITPPAAAAVHCHHIHCCHSAVFAAAAVHSCRCLLSVAAFLAISGPPSLPPFLVCGRHPHHLS